MYLDLQTGSQKKNRVEVSQGLLANVNGHGNFLKKTFITGDQTCIHGYDVETQMQSSQWAEKVSPLPKKKKKSENESAKNQGIVGCVF